MLGLKCVIADKAAPASSKCLEITNRKTKRIEEEKWKKAEREGFEAKPKSQARRIVIQILGHIERDRRKRRERQRRRESMREREEERHT